MLEDEFGDILRKAKRGTGTSDAQLAAQTGLTVHDLEAWTRGDGVRATRKRAPSRARSDSIPVSSPTRPRSAGNRT